LLALAARENAFPIDNAWDVSNCILQLRKSDPQKLSLFRSGLV
jgi:hypothetical protein